MQALLTNRMKRKLALVFALIVLALLGVSVRLAYINKTSGDSEDRYPDRREGYGF